MKERKVTRVKRSGNFCCIVIGKRNNQRRIECIEFCRVSDYSEAGIGKKSRSSSSIIVIDETGQDKKTSSNTNYFFVKTEAEGNQLLSNDDKFSSFENKPGKIYRRKPRRS